MFLAFLAALSAYAAPVADIQAHLTAVETDLRAADVSQRIRNISVWHTLFNQPEASVQERKRGCRPCWRLAGSPSFFMRVLVSPLRWAEGADRPMRCAHDGVPTQSVLRGSAEVSWPWAALWRCGWPSA